MLMGMTCQESPPLLHDLNRDLVWRGFVQMLPIALFVMVFGAAFGLAAVQSGVSPAMAVAMSALVFAGAAQFAALDMWGPQISVITLAATVFAINARHLLMGATLYPWLRHLSVSRRYGLMVLASDANWAMAMQAKDRQQPGFGILLGGGLALWVFWVLGTGLGVAFGGLVQDARPLGLDMVMGCFLLAMVFGDQLSARMLVIWIAAAGTSLLAHRVLHNNCHVVLGTLAGGLLSMAWVEAPSES